MSTLSKYKSISGRHEAIFRDRGSKFIAIALPFTDKASLKPLLLALKKEHPKANHLCYAYAFDWKNPTYRANDDGEPSGSAGLPILGKICPHQERQPRGGAVAARKVVTAGKICALGIVVLISVSPLLVQF